METAIEPVVPSKKNLFDLLYEPENIIRLAGMLGGENSARRYAQSVIALYTTDTKLRDCSVNSIMRAAFQAASLELSVDPVLREAYLIPRNKHIKGKAAVPARNGKPAQPAVQEEWIKEAYFQPHYNGLITLALRTRQYRVIYVGPVYRGYEVLQDPLTGLHYLEISPATDTHPQVFASPFPQTMPNRVMVNVTKGKRPYEDIIGYLGYFEMAFGGFKYSVWMTQEEIEAHAKEHSEAYKKGYDCLWTPGNPHRAVMEEKTVLIALSKHMVLTGSINENLRSALAAADDSNISEDESDGILDGVLSDVDGEPQYVTDETAQAPAQAPAPVKPAPVVPPLPTVRAPIGTTGYTRSLTYEVASGYVVEGKPLKDRTVDELEVMEQNPKRAQSIKNAIKIVRDHKVAVALVADLESK